MQLNSFLLLLFEDKTCTAARWANICVSSYFTCTATTGTYIVTNVGEYMNQFNVYSDEIHVTEEGWEEPAEVIYVKLLDVGASDTFNIADGQYIEIHEPASFELVLVSE